ncbi:hypothetical protein TWF173_002064 [Orbilia oligospora]|nr:hypothetical protein TWF173_002064 [Orbilia oligospora]
MTDNDIRSLVLAEAESLEHVPEGIYIPSEREMRRAGNWVMHRQDKCPMCLVAVDEKPDIVGGFGGNVFCMYHHRYTQRYLDFLPVVTPSKARNSCHSCGGDFLFGHKSGKCTSQVRALAFAICITKDQKWFKGFHEHAVCAKSRMKVLKEATPKLEGVNSRQIPQMWSLVCFFLAKEKYGTQIVTVCCRRERKAESIADRPADTLRANFPIIDFWKLGPLSKLPFYYPTKREHTAAVEWIDSVSKICPECLVSTPTHKKVVKGEIYCESHLNGKPSYEAFCRDIQPISAFTGCKNCSGVLHVRDCCHWMRAFAFAIYRTPRLFARLFDPSFDEDLCCGDCFKRILRDSRGDIPSLWLLICFVVRCDWF